MARLSELTQPLSTRMLPSEPLPCCWSWCACWSCSSEIRLASTRTWLSGTLAVWVGDGASEAVMIAPLLLVPFLKKGLDRRHELGHGQWLGQVGVGPDAQGGCPVLITGLGRDHHNRQGRSLRCRSQTVADFESVHAGEQHVQDDQVDLVGLGLLQSVEPVDRDNPLETLLLDGVFDKQSGMRIVVDDQQLAPLGQFGFEGKADAEGSGLVGRTLGHQRAFMLPDNLIGDIEGQPRGTDIVSRLSRAPLPGGMTLARVEAGEAQFEVGAVGGTVDPQLALALGPADDQVEQSGQRLPKKRLIPLDRGQFLGRHRAQPQPLGGCDIAEVVHDRSENGFHRNRSGLQTQFPGARRGGSLQIFDTVGEILGFAVGDPEELLGLASIGNLPFQQEFEEALDRLERVAEFLRGGNEHFRFTRRNFTRTTRNCAWARFAGLTASRFGRLIEGAASGQASLELLADRLEIGLIRLWFLGCVAHLATALRLSCAANSGAAWLATV